MGQIQRRIKLPTVLSIVTDIGILVGGPIIFFIAGFYLSNPVPCSFGERLCKVLQGAVVVMLLGVVLTLVIIA